ncbi:hypothetical protein BDK61_2946 [Haloarcula quadrata]|uniref:Uncharacterized protein n=1 Tax=Haloarcula quadrata TaxID=182779 RepID=A0A495R8I6_9EURY|nr:hypothetical protein BDK61_2946 [Haloarcula quadrata]
MTKQYRFYEVFNVSLYMAVIVWFLSLSQSHAQTYQGSERDRSRSGRENSPTDERGFQYRFIPRGVSNRP